MFIYCNSFYNIASRAAQSNSVYVSVLQISMVHSLRLEFLNEAEKEKNNGKGNSASAPSRFD